MKMKKTTYLLFLGIVALALAVTFSLPLSAQEEETLPPAQPQETVEEPILQEVVIFKAVSKQDDGSFMLLKVTKLGEATTEEDATVLVYNQLDRTINMDFSGDSHYAQQVNDLKKKTVNIIPGYYLLRVSAPGLSFKPNQDKVNFETRCKYKVDVVRLKEIVDYDNL